jgi:hypothetical protein
MPPFPPSQGPQFAGTPMLPMGLPQMPGQMSGSTVTRQPQRYSQSPVAPTPNTLPPAPGLPARPTFEAPTFNRDDMSRMHAGQQTSVGHNVPKKVVKKTYQEETEEKLETFLKGAKDEFKKKNADAAALQAKETKDAAELVDIIQAAEDHQKASTTPAEAAPSGKKKKSSKPQKLVYTDDSESPEEKLARRAKYAFNDASQ